MSAIPKLDDAVIAGMCAQMGLPDNAFGGPDDERSIVFKEQDSIDVCACPGSGKTTLLVAKLGAIMSKWDAVGRGVCVISHTNVARDEIGKKLGATSAGNKLLSYPHFVGTIHAFVNEFLAIPWIQANGYTVSTIDSEIATKKRWSSLSFATRSFLEKKFFSPRNLQATSVGPEIAGLKFKNDTDSYRAMTAAIKKSFEEGVFTHDEMFVWANDMLDKRPDIVEVIRKRFPCVFIDEAQDTDAEQSILLHRIFSAGDSLVTIQRFGDSNQAIYGGDGEGGKIPVELAFPQAANKRSLPKSLRFDQQIADFADPLGLDPYKMTGSRISNVQTLTASPQHTIFLFKDEVGARKVPEAFADLLSVTFSPADLENGLFKAVGQVHQSEKADNFPRSVGNYWELYDPSLSKSEVNPRTMLEHLLHGRARSLSSGNSFPTVDNLANGILKILDIMDHEMPLSGSGRRNRHRRLMEVIGENWEAAEDYVKLVQLVSHERLALTKENWEDQIQPLLKKVVSSLAGRIEENPLAGKFLSWTDTNTASFISSQSSSKGNVSIFERNGVSIPVQFGSIHSVKGETHKATLILETFYHDHNIAAIWPWFTGNKEGGTKAKSRDVDRLKLHYVALTRPSHLVCLGIHAPSIQRSSKMNLSDLIAALEGRGWVVTQI